MIVGCGVKSYNPTAIPSFTINQKIKIALREDGRKGVKTIRGTVKDITSNLVMVLKDSGVKETIMYKDFLTGHAKVVS